MSAYRSTANGCYQLGADSLGLRPPLHAQPVVFPAHAHQRGLDQLRGLPHGLFPNLLAPALHFFGGHAIPSPVIALPVCENNVSFGRTANADRDQVVPCISIIVPTPRQHRAHGHHAPAVEATTLLNKEEATEIHGFELCADCTMQIKCAAARSCFREPEGTFMPEEI